MILHVDADAFFCQVERRRNPALAGCPALAVQQHQDVIAADAGAKKAGVTKRTPPADARALLRRVGGALVHVHTTTGQRVSYRPYLAASHELHSLLASTELAREVSRDGFNGVAVEKASIDDSGELELGLDQEAFVKHQLYSVSDIRAHMIMKTT